MASVFLTDERRLRLGWRIALGVAGYGVAMLIVGVVTGLLGVLFYVARPQGGSGDAAAVLAWLRDPAVAIWLQILAAIPSLVLLGGLIFALRRWIDRRDIRSLGLRPPKSGWPQQAGIAVVLGGAPMVAALVLGVSGGGYVYTGTSFSAQTWVLIPALVIMAFNEEILCRGYFLQNFVDEGRPWLGIVVSSAIFWLFHSLNPQIWSTPLASINLFGAGVVLALAYLASGNIWFPTLLHWSWNLVQGVIFQLPVSGLQIDGFFDFALRPEMTWLTGGEFGPEGGVAVTAATVVMAGMLYVSWRRARARASEPAPPSVSAFD